MMWHFVAGDEPKNLWMAEQLLKIEHNERVQRKQSWEDLNTHSFHFRVYVWSGFRFIGFGEIENSGVKGLTICQ